MKANSIAAFLSAEFAAAAALIAMGAVLGRLRIYQYALLGLLIVPAYMLNEWLVLDGGLGITKGFVDAAGSITIHTFGAYFGMGLIFVLSNAKHREMPIESDIDSACWDRWCCGFFGQASAVPLFRRRRCSKP